MTAPRFDPSADRAVADSPREPFDVAVLPHREPFLMFYFRSDVLMSLLFGATGFTWYEFDAENFAYQILPTDIDLLSLAGPPEEHLRPKAGFDSILKIVTQKPSSLYAESHGTCSARIASQCIEVFVSAWSGNGADRLEVRFGDYDHALLVRGKSFLDYALPPGMSKNGQRKWMAFDYSQMPNSRNDVIYRRSLPRRSRRQRLDIAWHRFIIKMRWKFLG